MSDSDVSAIAVALRPTLTRLYLALRRHTPIREYTAAQASALTVLLDHGPMRMGELADREREVLAVALDGRSAADIAARVHLSPGTVRNHLSSAIGKTGTSNRVEAARRAQDLGWL